MLNWWRTGVTHTAARGCALALAAWLWSPSGAAAQTARVTLLPNGQRASVVVELDDVLTGATAIQAPDSQTVEVEIGPVRGRVINQLLQASADSPLVSRVRIRGITRGADGTIVSVQVTGKAPISGSVRRSARRVYIDLEPLAVVRPLEADTARPAVTPDRGAPAVAAATPKSAVPLTPRPASRSAAQPTAPPVPTPKGGLPVAEARPPAATATAMVPPRNGRVNATLPLVADPSTSEPTPAVAAATPGTAPAVVEPTTASSSRPVARLGNRNAATTAMAGGTGTSDVEALAERLARVPDVKGLERLKADLLAKRKGPERDELIAKVDQYVLEAQRNRLAADAALFRDQTPPAAPSPASQLAAARALRPQLEQIASAASDWTGGPAPQELVTLSATLPKLRQLRLPAQMAEAHAELCNSLEGLAVIWAKSSAEPIDPGSAELPQAVARARSAVYSFLALERSLSMQSNAQ